MQNPEIPLNIDSIIEEMAEMKTEVEQLLYYSIPGFFVEFLFLLFLFIIGKITFITSTAVAILVAIAIPVGYITYQAYASLYFYEYVWRKGFSGEDSNLKLIGKMVDEKASELGEELSKKVRDSISRIHLFNFFSFRSQNIETIEYSWRLVNLINGRAVAVFSCLFAFFIPWFFMGYSCATSYITTLPKISLVLEEVLRALIPYYALLIVFVSILASRISHIKQILSRHNQGIIISGIDILDELVLQYVALNAVLLVENELLSKKKETPSNRKLLNEAYEELKAKRWKEVVVKAKELYQSISAK